MNHELAAAFGVPVPILFPVGDGQARRAAMSAFIEGSLIPMARVIEAEAVAKLGDVKIDLSGLYGAADLQARARALKSLVDAGLSVEEARAICFSASNV